LTYYYRTILNGGGVLGEVTGTAQNNRMAS